MRIFPKFTSTRGSLQVNSALICVYHKGSRDDCFWDVISFPMCSKVTVCGKARFKDLFSVFIFLAFPSMSLKKFVLGSVLDHGRKGIGLSSLLTGAFIEGYRSQMIKLLMSLRKATSGPAIYAVIKRQTCLTVSYLVPSETCFPVQQEDLSQAMIKYVRPWKKPNRALPLLRRQI